MNTQILINAQQIVKIRITPAIPVNDLTSFLEDIGYWEYKEYKTVKRLFRKSIEVYAPGWYRTPTISYNCKKKYIETDAELISFLKKKYTAKYQIQDKTLYRCIRIIIFLSNESNEYLYFNDNTEADNFLNTLYSTIPSLKDVTKYY